MEPKNDPKVLYNDLYPLLGCLSRWSRGGLQAFIDSGLLTDSVEAAKTFVSFNEDPLFQCLQQEGMFTQSEERGSVTAAQFNKIVGCVPLSSGKNFETFVTIFKEWSHTAGWWDNHHLSQSLRHKFRVVLGLPPCVVVKNMRGLEVTFRLAQEPLSFPIADYYNVARPHDKRRRHATPQEVEDLSLPDLTMITKRAPILCKGGEKWKLFSAKPDQVGPVNGAVLSSLEVEAALKEIPFFVPFVSV